MTRIAVYDDTSAALDEIAEQLDLSVAEVIDMLTDYADELIRDYGK